MEIESLKVDDQMAVKAKDTAGQDMRLALLMVESYEANRALHQVGDGIQPSKEAKRQVLAELLEERKRALALKEVEALEKDLGATEYSRQVDQEVWMCKGVKVECDRMRYGSNFFSFNPVPLVYPDNAFCRG